METLKITLNLEDKRKIHHPFHKYTLNKELVNFLYEECLGKPKKQKIDIHILSQEVLENDEKEEIRNLIHQHFKEEIQEIKIKKRSNYIFNICIFFFGLLFLFLSFLFKQELMKEIVSILGWIAIWDVVESFLFDDSQESLRLKRYRNLASARIYFKEEE